MDNIWNVILHKLDNNNVARPTNNPVETGNYLCTCVHFFNGKEIVRYLQVMHYNSEKNCWHDCNNVSGISHNILAWTDKIKPCDFTDYDYLVGGYFVEKQ